MAESFGKCTNLPVFECYEVQFALTPLQILSSIPAVVEIFMIK